jgi:hypothetical protein
MEADRRARLLVAFVVRQRGTRNEKVRRTYEVLDESQSAREFDPLHRLPAQLRAVLNGCPPSERESRPNA